MESSIFIDLVRYGHLFAVAIGFGAAFMADYVVLTRLRRGISAETMGILTLCHQLIWGAVIAMWITGICLIGIRTGFAPSAFTPKLFAKLFVVTLLTGNAVIIGRLGFEGSETRRHPRHCRLHTVRADLFGTDLGHFHLQLAMGAGDGL